MLKIMYYKIITKSTLTIIITQQYFNKSKDTYIILWTSKDSSLHPSAHTFEKISIFVINSTCIFFFLFSNRYIFSFSINENIFLLN